MSHKYKTSPFQPAVGMVVSYTFTPKYTCVCCNKLTPGEPKTVKAKVTLVEKYKRGGKEGLEVTIHDGTREIVLYNSDFYNRCKRVA